MKTLKTIKILMLALIVGFMSAACSNKTEASKVAEKIETGSELSPSDYTVVIEYLGDFAKRAQPIQDKINNLPAGDPTAMDYQKELDSLKASDKLIDLFNDTLDRASQSQLGADNVALVDKYAGYEWFTAPGWATVQTDPSIGGVELQSPSSDTTGVVAGAVDELKVVE